MRTTKEYRAISPSMNDQWSGKILSRKTRPPLATPEALVELVDDLADLAVGAPWPPACCASSVVAAVSLIVVRSQKPGPTGWS